MKFFHLALPLFLAVTACSNEEPEEEFSEELGSATDEIIGESATGPLVKATSSEVWAVANQWADKDTANAKLAGVAWGANSGLTWDEKFAKWVSTVERVKGQPRFAEYVADYQTFRLTTPEGRVIDAPVLECADVGIWLRVTFAAWYKLPFYLTGYAGGRAIYMGHFGVVDKTGTPVRGYAAFKTQYKDYSSTWKKGDAWPVDPVLARKHVGSDDGAGGLSVDGKPLPASAGAGAYYDQLFLNKRAGHLLTLLDVNFGSANLADGTATYHAKAASVRPGDLLIERWQKTGIGHVLPVMTVTRPSETAIRATLASGSMPRRQPHWESPADSAHYFSVAETGGPGTSWEGHPFAKLGGGLKRWRTAVVSAGRWTSIVPIADRANWILDTDLQAIAARPGQFETLMAEEDPAVAKETAARLLAAARTKLRAKPASCSTRTAREAVFEDIYELYKADKSRAEVDKSFRTLEDYVFGELEYTQSKTCCWNTTTPAMAEIVLAYAEEEQDTAAAGSTCVQPTVFRAEANGYARWKNYAASIGRAADWREWSEDEPCAQRGSTLDALTTAGKLPYSCQ